MAPRNIEELGDDLRDETPAIAFQLRQKEEAIKWVREIMAWFNMQPDDVPDTAGLTGAIPIPLPGLAQIPSGRLAFSAKHILKEPAMSGQHVIAWIMYYFQISKQDILEFEG